ncbi:MAG: transcription termination factor Rho [Lachnospiraceae bacterium]|nr:transcription termination factor Rho [Lachnospiraceae bacterium]
MKEKLETFSLMQLRSLARNKGLKGVSMLKKAELIAMLCEEALKSEEERENETVSEEVQQYPAAVAESSPYREKNTESVESNERFIEEGDYQQKTYKINSGRPYDKTYNDRSANDRTFSDKNSNDRTPNDRTFNDRASNDRAFNDKVSNDRNSQERTIGDRLADRNPSDRTSNEKVPIANDRRYMGDEPEIHLDSIPKDKDALDSGKVASGILEVMPDGYGFIRCENYLPGDNDVYVAPSQIRKFNLRTGDIITGNTRFKAQGEKFSALLYVKNINGLLPSEAAKRLSFENMTPIFPNERIRLEGDSNNIAMRIMDIISPVGKGQRGMIVSPPKAGKTTLLKQIANSVTRSHPEIHVIILLIDERPEEVTDIKESISGNVEVIYSTFDELPEHHKRVSEMVIERARRLVELKKDVMILLDSITRLSRAYNLTVPPSGRTLSGGLDPAALHMPKRFFGAARNMREGGSLTILATALVDTGSKMDDVVYEEFKGTGNMEMVLNRKLQEKRVFPAIDLQKSSTRRDDLLLTEEEIEASDIIHKALIGIKAEEATEKLIEMFAHSDNNQEFMALVKKIRFY